LSTTEEIFYHEAYKILISITDYVKNHEMDRSMIDVYVLHFLLEYDEAGNKTTTITRYETRECTDADFLSEYEKNYWEWVDYPEYCFDDPNNTLSILGIRKNMMNRVDTSYFKIILERCNDENGRKSTVQCSDELVIDEWTQSKQVQVKII